MDTFRYYYILYVNIPGNARNIVCQRVDASDTVSMKCMSREPFLRHFFLRLRKEHHAASVLTGSVSYILGENDDAAAHLALDNGHNPLSLFEKPWSIMVLINHPVLNIIHRQFVEAVIVPLSWRFYLLHTLAAICL